MTTRLNRIVSSVGIMALAAVVGFSAAARAETTTQGSSPSAAAATDDFNPLCGHHNVIASFNPLCGHHYPT